MSKHAKPWNAYYRERDATIPPWSPGAKIPRHRKAGPAK